MWSSKYDDEKKHSSTLELQLKEMANQLDDYDLKFQALQNTGNENVTSELVAELEAQIEELTIERDDLQDEMDSLRTQLLVNLLLPFYYHYYQNIISLKLPRFMN